MIVIKEINNSLSTSDILERYFENFLSILDQNEEQLKKYMGDTFHDRSIITVAVKSYREKLFDYSSSISLCEGISLLNFIKKFSSRTKFCHQIYLLLVFENLKQSQDVWMS
jgi:hypothetical protein